MAERLFDYEPATGLKTYFDYSDDNDGTWIFRHEQDTSPILDANKSAQADGFDRKADYWHAASIPAIVILEWITKHGVDLYNPNHAAGVRRLLNSSDYRHLRRANFQL